MKTAASVLWIPYIKTSVMYKGSLKHSWEYDSTYSFHERQQSNSYSHYTYTVFTITTVGTKQLNKLLLTCSSQNLAKWSRKLNFTRVFACNHKTSLSSMSVPLSLLRVSHTCVTSASNATLGSLTSIRLPEILDDIRVTWKCTILSSAGSHTGVIKITKCNAQKLSLNIMLITPLHMLSIQYIYIYIYSAFLVQYNTKQ